MTLFKTSFWTGLSVFIKGISTFIISKIIAIYTGPVGLAVIEQFQNFMQIVRTFSGSLIQQGIVKYVAEYKDNEEIKSQILSSATIFCLIVSLILGITLTYFSSEIARVVLQSIVYKKVVIAFAASIILFSLNCFLIGILNGEMEIKKYAGSNIVNTLLVLLITLYLIHNYGLYGGLLALACNQSIILFFTLFLVMRCKWFKFHSFIQGLDFDSLSKLITYALITIIVALATPISQIIVRNYIAHILSWQDAGYWQAMTKFSTNYFIVIDATFSIYYLPRLSAIHSIIELKSEIFRCYKFLMPLAIISVIFIFLLKKPIVMILYSKEFIPMIVLFKYQLIGDLAKMGAWVLFYLMIAKTMVKALIVTELCFLISYTLATIIFVQYYGLIGTAMGYALSNILYFICMLLYIVKYIRAN